MEFSFIPGYIFLYILEDKINATESNSIEQKIKLQTNLENNSERCINFDFDMAPDIKFDCDMFALQSRQRFYRNIDSRVCYKYFDK